MTRDLLSAREVITRLDPERVAAEIDAPLRAATDGIVRTIMTEYEPELWRAMPGPARRAVIARAQGEVPRIVRAVLAEIQADPEAVFDLKGMVVTNLVTDKALLNRIFLEAGRKEFRFIAHSGIWFGASIGVLQLGLWILFRQPLIMPLFGLMVGWFTDWLALKLIFNPKKPRRFLGVEVQGLFLKRRREVAADYGNLIADQIITPRKVINAVLTGPLSDRVFAMVRRQVQQALDRSAGVARPLLVATVGSSRYQEMKLSIASQVMARLPHTLRHVESYAKQAMDVRSLLVEKMQHLSDVQFERLIRPAFEEDEWKLIAVGALLGFFLGELQALVLEHLS
jgi:uncharacterized membrane protein YheB (UPF0754 family)